MRTLDFICVGAQKSGTTTLFHALRSHPDVYIPPSKEAPILHKEGLSLGDWHSYMGDYFPARLGVPSVGTVSPQYLVSEVAIRNYSRFCAGARVIAVLRDPVERIVSHYQMDLRRGKAPSNLEDAVRAELSADTDAALAATRYVGGSMYGHWLSRWSTVVEPASLLVLATVDLSSNVQGSSAKLCRHLGVNELLLDRLEEVHHVGGGGRRWRGLESVRRSRFADLARSALPRRWRGAIGYRLEQINVAPTPRPELSEPLATVLRSRLEDDRRVLESVTGAAFAWSVATPGGTLE